MNDDSMREQRKELLLLAQQKLDDLNRPNNNNNLMQRRRGSSSSSNLRGAKNNTSCTTLLSTLLYVALMTHKLEDMKVMLQTEDPSSYDEWRYLFDTLHSPEFHSQGKWMSMVCNSSTTITNLLFSSISQERILQNQRVKTAYARKKEYKQQSIRLEQELSIASTQLKELQKLSNETNHQMSKSINTLQQERASLVTKDEERLHQIEELNIKINQLQSKVGVSDTKLQTLQTELDNKDKLLKDKATHISELEQQVSQYKQDAATATTNANHAQLVLSESKSQLQDCESKYETYRVDTDASISKLQQELVDVKSSNAILSTKLDAANKTLERKTNQLDNKKESTTIKTLESLDELKTQSNCLKNIIQTGMSNLHDSIVESIVDETKCDMEKISSHNEQVDTALDVISNKTSSLEQYSNEIQKGLVNVKDTLDALVNKEERQQDGISSSLHQEILNVKQQLDSISKLQLSTNLQNEVMLEKIQQSNGGGEEAREGGQSAADDMNTELLQKISSSVDVVSNKCTKIEDTLSSRQDVEHRDMMSKLNVSSPKANERQGKDLTKSPNSMVSSPSSAASELVDNIVTEAARFLS